MAPAFALDPAYARVTVEQFLDMDFGDAKAELDDGVVFMMAGGSEEHARVASNILIALGIRLRGSGCRPYGSDLAARTGQASVRFPDVSVYCDRPGVAENARKKLLGDPVVVVEVLSPTTRGYDQRVKLEEYRAMEGVAHILLVDPETERVRHVRRQGRGWQDEWGEAAEDVALDALGLVLPAAEIFAAD